MAPISNSSPDLKMQRPEVGCAPIGSAAEIRLLELWESAPGWRGWFSTVDHKEIGLRYLVTAFVFLLMGGVEALIMRFNSPALTKPYYRRNNTINSLRCMA